MKLHRGVKITIIFPVRLLSDSRSFHEERAADVNHTADEAFVSSHIRGILQALSLASIMWER
jgi:hypothetical protein